MPTEFSLKSNVVDLAARTIKPAEVRVADGKIASIESLPEGEAVEGYLTPGFVDAHVHVESSMLVPTEFARAAVTHGTVGSVSDPHEIGNVLGVAGVEYMLENASHSPFKFCFGAPSCVPATTFETAGAEITVEDVERLLDDDRIGYMQATARTADNGDISTGQTVKIVLARAGTRMEIEIASSFVESAAGEPIRTPRAAFRAARTGIPIPAKSMMAA